jgi:hypothetical protein
MTVSGDITTNQSEIRDFHADKGGTVPATRLIRCRGFVS